MGRVRVAPGSRFAKRAPGIVRTPQQLEDGAMSTLSSGLREYAQAAGIPTGQINAAVSQLIANFRQEVRRVFPNS